MVTGTVTYVKKVAKGNSKKEKVTGDRKEVESTIILYGRIYKSGKGPYLTVVPSLLCRTT